MAVLSMVEADNMAERIRALESGADDVLARPIHPRELKARLHAITRRLQPNASALQGLCVGSLTLDLANRRAMFRGQSVHLNNRQFAILAMLVRHADQIVTRQMLIEQVWGADFRPATNLIESNLSRLRARLIAAGCAAIATLRGEGYMLRSDACS